tara:strand:- start:1562 stop:2260 length:699 start_codon:yes stop_codon:yes gene_type:complete
MGLDKIMTNKTNSLTATRNDLFKSIKDTKTEFHFLLEINFLFDQEQLRCYETEVINVFHKILNEERGLFETIDPCPASNNSNAWKQKNWKTNHDIFVNPICTDLASLWKSRAASKIKHHWLTIENLGMVLDMEGIPWEADFIKPQVLFKNIFDKLNYKFLFMYLDINIHCYISSNNEIEEYIPGLESEYQMHWSYSSSDSNILKSPQGMDGNAAFETLNPNDLVKPSKIKLA